MRIVRIPWTQRTRHVSLAMLAAGFALSGTYSYGAANAGSDQGGGSGQDAVAASWKCPQDVADASNSARGRWCGNHRPTPTSTMTTASATSTTAAPPSTTTTTKPPTTPTTTPPTTATTAPSTTTTSSSQPTLSGWPNASNTGVPAGTALKVYTGPLNITTPNVTLDAQIFNGKVTVAATNVTITRSQINGGVWGNDNASFTVTDSTIVAPVPKTGTGEERGVIGTNVTALRNNVSGGNSGGECNHCLIRDNYIHGQTISQSTDFHASGFRMDNHTQLIHNAIACDALDTPSGGGCSGGITGYGDFGPVTDNLIQNNLFLPSPHAAFCTYGGSSKGKPYSNDTRNIVFKDNVFSRGPNGDCALYGPVGDYDPNAPGNVWSNNRWEDGNVLVPYTG